MSNARSVPPAAIGAPSLARFSSRPLQIFSALLVASAVIYCFRLGDDALGASAAYSAWAATKPGVVAIIETPVMHDPGKQVLYYVLLHYFTEIFGLSEVALRSLSVIFGLVSVILVFALGREMFDDDTALAATAIWAFNPLAVVFARTARMYPMFIAIALAHLLMLLRVRRRPSLTGAIGCGLLGAAMPYTHMAGLLILGSEGAMLLRDLTRGRRDTMAWVAMLLALALFFPYAPIAARQSNDLMYGHSLDYLGPSYNYSLVQKILAAILAAGATLWLLFGHAREQHPDEPIRWLLAWIALPTMAFLVGSALLHPMFNPRYLAPEIAAGTVLTAAAIGAWSAKWRNLIAAGFALICLIMLPFARSEPQPWRDLARQVSTSGDSSQPVFFEAGFVSKSHVPNAGFPFGYYSIVFDYYFHGPNPRVIVPGYDPSSARSTIEQKVAAAGGGWLVSWKDAETVKAELPDSRRFTIVEKYREQDIGIYRLTPTPH